MRAPLGLLLVALFARTAIALPKASRFRGRHGQTSETIRLILKNGEDYTPVAWKWRIGVDLVGTEARVTEINRIAKTPSVQISDDLKLVTFKRDPHAYAVKKRTDFGRQPLFCEQGPAMCASVAASAPERPQYILRNPVHQGTQNTPAFAQHYVNTVRAETASSGANHSEGGWPKDVNIHDPEATQRYRRKIEKDDGYIHCVMSLADSAEHYVRQNNATDMYRAPFAELRALPPLERSSARTVNVYRDSAAAAATAAAAAASRPVGSLSWQPDGGRRFAATYLDMDFDRVTRGSLAAFQWDVESATEPELTFHPPCGLLDLQYSPREGALLAGALVSGQVARWDARAGGATVALSAPHTAHRDLARCVLFLNSKSGMEIFSGGPDGVCKWWDLRDLGEPTDEIVLDPVKSPADAPSLATACGVSVLEYESTLPTRFMVGTENGLVFGGNRKGKTPFEKLPAKYEAHLGPVRSLQRNPHFLKNFLTVGDWAARVWSEECRDSAVLWAAAAGERAALAGGAWSPARPSVLALARADGALQLWDLLRSPRAPALALRLGRAPLRCLRVQEAVPLYRKYCDTELQAATDAAQGALVAVGARDGTVYMVELSHQLVEIGKNDKALLNHVLERESRRERVLEGRARELRLRLRQAREEAGGAGGGSPAAAGSLAELDAAAGDRDLAAATADYMQQVKKELAAF